MSVPYEGLSNTTGTPGLSGTNSKVGGIGVSGESVGASGVSRLVLGGQQPETDEDRSVFAVLEKGVGVMGTTNASEATGVVSISDSGLGLYGASWRSSGVQGVSGYFDAVVGVTYSGAHAGATGRNLSAGVGVYGTTSSLYQGGQDAVAGVWGENIAGGIGVKGTSKGGDGVSGFSSSPQHAGVSANNTAPSKGGVPSGFGLWASSNNTAIYARGEPAGYFEGDHHVIGNHYVTGDVILVNSSGDIAEDFDVEDGSARVEPGTVLVIGSNGKLCASTDAYDTRVAGVVSGAGELKPAIVLQRIESCSQRSPIALVGKAFCKVDALFGSIQPGDLLTTSSTPGHAMKLLDHSRAAGAILGKALGGLTDGQGLIPILVSPH